MAIRTYACDDCDQRVSKDVPMTARACPALVRYCPQCRRRTGFQRVYDPTYGTFGMYTRRYTGQEAAVSGWGTYNLDYGKSGSDLVRGRATEITKTHPLHDRAKHN